MIDILDAPLPFLIGVETEILEKNYEGSPEDVTTVKLDANAIYSSEKILETVKLPQREYRTLREKLIRATACITKRPDPEL